MSLSKDFKFGHPVLAIVQVLPSRAGIEVKNRAGALKRYDTFEDLPLNIKKPLSLLMLNPDVEYVENVGRSMGRSTFWIYKPKKEIVK